MGTAAIAREMRRRNRRSALGFGVATLLVLVFGDGCDDVREDELQCEEAVAHMQGCCDSFEPDVSCTFQGVPDCSGETPIYPDISIDQSQCIRDLSCAEVRERGLCEKATWPTALEGTCS
jgi:hypothetical protein